MSALVSRVLSQADKLPIINNASSWFPNYYASKKEEAAVTSLEEQQDEDNFNAYQRLTTTSPRYSMAPPPYEATNSTPIVVENKRFSTLTTIWKRASFSSSTNTDIKTPIVAPSTIDKKQMDHAVTLINVATDMNNSGNQQMAIDLYMMGLDKLMSALPLESDPSVKASLEKKLVEIKEHHQLNLVSLDDLMKETEQEEEDSDGNRPIRSQISNLVINAAVLSAIALKKSPIPDAFSTVMNFAVDGIQVMDEKHQIRKRTWDLAATGVAKAVEIDRQFEIHQMVTGAVYTGLSAFVKAGMAYAETPGHNNASSSSATK